MVCAHAAAAVPVHLLSYFGINQKAVEVALNSRGSEGSALVSRKSTSSPKGEGGGESTQGRRTADGEAVVTGTYLAYVIARSQSILALCSGVRFHRETFVETLDRYHERITFVVYEV